MKLYLFAAALLIAGAPAGASEPAPASAHPAGHKMTAESGDGASAMDHSSHCGLPMGEGVITALDVAKASVSIDHKPIPALGWGEMAMTFRAEKAVDLSAFAAGDRVHFLLASGKKSKGHAIAAMCSPDAEAGAHDACMGAMHKTAMKIASKKGETCATECMDHCSMDHGSMDHGSMDHGPERKADDRAASGGHDHH